MPRYPFDFPFLSVILVTGLSFNFCIFQQSARTQTTPVQVSEDVTPPPDPQKPATDPNITRGACFTSSLISIKPEQETPRTIADTPTFLFYIPPLKLNETKSSEFQPLHIYAEFEIKDKNKKIIYSTNFNLEARSGLLRLSLPEDVAGLFVETGNPYSWYFEVNCNNTGDKSAIAMIEGKIQRISADTQIQRKLLPRMNPDERFQLYQSSGLDYDALILLDELRRQNPNDVDLTTAWENFLKTNGLETLIGVPFIDD